MLCLYFVSAEEQISLCQYEPVLGGICGPVTAATAAAVPAIGVYTLSL